MTLASAPPPPDPTLASFYGQPWWMIVLKVVVIFAFLMVMTLFAIWAERRVIGRMQQRPGPNRAGPFGLLQSLMDGIKLPLKEDIVPRHVDKLLFWLAPAIALVPALEDAPIVEQWVGFRPLSADGVPIIGPAALRGLYYCTGHGPTGIAPAPGTIALLIALIEGTPPPVPAAPYDPFRFGRATAE